MTIAAPSTPCSEASAAADEPIAGTAVADGERFVLLEYRGHWERDVGACGLPAATHERLVAVTERHPSTRVQLVRQTGRSAESAESPRGLSVFVVRTRTPRGVWRARLERLEELDDLDLEAALVGSPGSESPRRPLAQHDGPLYVVCTHGRRDACCARHGAALYHALRATLPSSDAVWESTHQGGHRFAATLLYLPAGIHYGRLAADDAQALVAAHARGDIVGLSHYRGRTGLPPPAQVAEAWLREQAGHRALEGPELVSLEPLGDGGSLVTLDLGERQHRVRVEPHAGTSSRPASCGGRPEPWKGYLVAAHSETSR